MTTKPAFLARAAAAALALAAGGCGEEIQERYELQIIGPADVDYLAGARRVVLEVMGKEVARADITPGTPFSLTGTGVSAGTTVSGAIRVRAFDAAGQVVASGQTPDLELRLGTPPTVVVFIQKPGTFGRTKNANPPRARHFGVAALATPATEASAASIPIALYGLGKVPITDPMTMVKREDASSSFYFYNPLLHASELGGETTVNNMRAPRYDVAAAYRPDTFTVLLFGGIGPSMPAMAGSPEAPVAHLELLRMRRLGFGALERDFALTSGGQQRTTSTPGIARSAAAMAVATQVYAFGGRGADGAALDSVVVIDPAALGEAMVLSDKKMAAPRVGHTATPVSVGGQSEVLVVGGGPAGGSVAEVFNPSTGFTAVGGSPGPMRRNHAAVVLGDGKVLIIGGLGPGDAPLADIRRYDPVTRQMEAAPAMLTTARSQFAAFLVDDDVVVAGGLDAAGAPIGNAEVFSATRNLLARPVATLVARAGAVPMVLSNGSAVLAGGEEMPGISSQVIEIYQPNLPPP